MSYHSGINRIDVLLANVRGLNSWYKVHDIVELLFLLRSDVTRTALRAHVYPVQLCMWTQHCYIWDFGINSYVLYIDSESFAFGYNSLLSVRPKYHCIITLSPFFDSFHVFSDRLSEKDVWYLSTFYCNY